MSNQRAVNFALILLAGLAIYVMSQLLDQVWVILELNDQAIVGPVNLPIGIGGVLGLGLALGVKQHKKSHTFLLEAASEIRKVVWPGRQEVMDSTRVVIIATIFMAAVLGSFDLVWAKLAKVILQ